MKTVFYIAAFTALVSTLMAVTRRNPVHALLYLIVSFLSLALVFFILGAPFAAALEVIIYAGAIMVFFVFVIMMLNLGEMPKELVSGKKESLLAPETWVGPAALVVVLMAELLYVLIHIQGLGQTGGAVPPKRVGAALFGPYVLATELASMLLLAGLVGAYHLGRRDGLDKEEGRDDAATDA